MNAIATTAAHIPVATISPKTESTTTELYCSKKQALYSPHGFEKFLNNEAAFLIEQGNEFREAIRLLKRALDLSKWRPKDNDLCHCGSCNDCSLDSCVFQQTEAIEEQLQAEKRDSRGKSGRPSSHERFASNESQHHNCGKQGPSTTSEDVFLDGRYIYRRPLRLTQTCLIDHHSTKGTFIVIVMFNLALAHQLLAASTQQFDKEVCTKTNLGKALKLYELCIQSMDLYNVSDATSLRLKLLIMNNCGEIHHRFGDLRKHRACLEYVLRSLLLLSHGKATLRVETYNCDVLTQEEIDGLYRNMQSSTAVFGKHIHARMA